MSIEEKLEAQKNICQNCFDCELSKTRNNVVFSDGNPKGGIVLIGEAPGANEDATGKPFVGRAGKLLDELFLSQGLSRQNEIYICNTIKCRPPNNRVPTEVEKAQCRKYLDSQLEILQPKIILLCGATALKSFMGNKVKISQVRGQWFEHAACAKLMPIFHPSYLLRNPTLKEGSPKWLMLEDIKEIKRVYSSLL